MRQFSSEELIDKYIDRDRMKLYLDEVEKANAKFSLYARNLERQDLEFLIADCLVPFELGWMDREFEAIIDIGSGWGLPAIPFLLVKDSLSITMVERSQKKSAFLSLLLHRLNIRASVYDRDLAAMDTAIRFSLILSRRVAFEDKLIKQIKSRSHAESELFYFGPAYPEKAFGSFEAIDYAMDRLSDRKIVKAKIV